ncbi:putative zinc-binding metallopeptidase [Candidatus Woesearchaeota archaeon]|nr:putative zinc-binding metallopeptidase [Candidatus Woesearchaeota archaeon]
MKSRYFNLPKKRGSSITTGLPKLPHMAYGPRKKNRKPKCDEQLSLVEYAGIADPVFRRTMGELSPLDKIILLLLAATFTNGCQITRQGDSIQDHVLAIHEHPNQNSAKISCSSYMEGLKLLDDQFQTPEEAKFEQEFPGLNLQGSPHQLTAGNIDPLRSAVSLLPKDTVDKLQGLDLYIMIKGDFENKFVEFENQNGFYDGESILLHRVSSTIFHEFGHAIQDRALSEEQRTEFNERWNSIQINGRSLAELYGCLLKPGSSDLWADGTDGPRHGFCRAYGSLNQREDVATTMALACSNTDAMIVPQDGYEIMLQKVGLLKEFGFITAQQYDHFVLMNSLNSHNLDSLLSYLDYPNQAILHCIWDQFTQAQEHTPGQRQYVIDNIVLNKNASVDAKTRAVYFLQSTAGEIEGETAAVASLLHSGECALSTTSYLADHDSEGVYFDDVLACSDSDDIFVLWNIIRYIANQKGFYADKVTEVRDRLVEMKNKPAGFPSDDYCTFVDYAISFAENYLGE